MKFNVTLGLLKISILDQKLFDFFTKPLAEDILRLCWCR